MNKIWIIDSQYIYTILNHICRQVHIFQTPALIFNGQLLELALWRQREYFYSATGG